MLLKIKPERSGEWQQAMEFLHHFSSSLLISRKKNQFFPDLSDFEACKTKTKKVYQREFEHETGHWTEASNSTTDEEMEDSDSMWKSVHVIRQIALDLDKEDRVVIAWARLAIKIKADRDTEEIASKILQSIEGLCWKADRTQ